MKFRKLQKASSIIPYYSTFFILIVTMIQLKKNRASPKLWGRFSLIFFISGSLVSFVDAFLMAGKNPILNVIVAGLIFGVANCALVDLQSESKKQMECCSQTPEANRGLPAGIIISTVVIVLALICAVLSIIFTSVFFGEDSPDYVDTNGEDNTSLVHITVDEIISTTGDYVATNAAFYNDGGHTLVPASLDSTDYDNVVFRCKQINGILTLQTTKVHENTVTLNIDSEIRSGNMEIFILVDGTYFSHIEAGSHQTIELNDVAEKTIVVRMAAESAEVSLTVTRDYT